MSALNRWKLLWSYLRRQDDVRALPVEYIVETTARCNIYCPMCPRETHPQPKEDMDEQVFRRLVDESAGTAEHMMLIGLGEPLLDPRIFDRIVYCEQHGISTLISTNGTLLDEKAAARLLDSPLSHITLSFDGYSRETFEFYRKGAKFDRVRDNFVRFCRMKHERGSKLKITVQMVRMDGNRHEEADFIRFWRGVPGVDLIRVKEDETNLLRPEPRGRQPKHPCHYLWRGAMYVRHNGDVYPCCQSYMLDGQPVGSLRRQALREIFNGAPMRQMRRLHAQGRAAEIDICARCCTVIPHPILAAGSLLLHGRIVRALLPLVERWSYRLFGGRMLKPQAAPAPQPLVQIGPAGRGPSDSR
ncbi:MAG: radical SAM protein [Bryobacteraceae bacterium]|nr:radical SAM protein [Bryobacteraceae bacterium]